MVLSHKLFCSGMGPGFGEIGDGGGDFLRIERFESIVTYSEGGAAAGRNREVIAVLRIALRRRVASLPAIETLHHPLSFSKWDMAVFARVLSPLWTQGSRPVATSRLAAP